VALDLMTTSQTAPWGALRCPRPGRHRSSGGFEEIRDLHRRRGVAAVLAGAGALQPAERALPAELPGHPPGCSYIGG
jgi:hypothetical protein